MLALKGAFSSFKATPTRQGSLPGYLHRNHRSDSVQRMLVEISSNKKCCIYATFKENPESCGVFTLPIDLSLMPDNNEGSGTTDLGPRTNKPSQRPSGKTVMKTLYHIVCIDYFKKNRKY